MERFAPVSSRDLASVASTSCSAASQMTLEEQHRMITEEVIQLKCNIAEQKGKQDELNFDWQKLHTEQSEIQEALVEINTECDDLKFEIDQTTEDLEKAKLRLDLLATERLPEQKIADEVRDGYISVQAELKATEVQMEHVKSSGESLHREIEDLKQNAAQISSDRANLATESDKVEREIKDLRGGIAKMRLSVQETKSSTAMYQVDLTCIRKGSEKIAKQNEVLESKIAIREEMAKK